MMKLKLLAAVSAVWLSGAFMAAHAASSVSAITGEVGSVLVVRGGQTFTLSARDELFDGDRIVTRSGGSVKIVTDGCTRTLPAMSTVVIDGAFCDAVFASASRTVLAEAGITPAGTFSPLPLVAGVAVVAVAAASLDSSPSSN